MFILILHNGFSKEDREPGIQEVQASGPQSPNDITSLNLAQSRLSRETEASAPRGIVDNAPAPWYRAMQMVSSPCHCPRSLLYLKGFQKWQKVSYMHHEYFNDVKTGMSGHLARESCMMDSRPESSSLLLQYPSLIAERQVSGPWIIIDRTFPSLDICQET